MSAQIIDGKKLSEEIFSELKSQIKNIESKFNLKPHLAVILVGNNPASKVYVSRKEKKSFEIGMDFSLHKFSETETEEKIIETIKNLNENNDVSGIIVQLPLPKRFNERKILDCIRIEKDVDGLTSQNLGRLFAGEPYFIPCTPAGIVYILKKINCPLEGKKATVVGRSNLVGKPVSILLLKENCTVTICHSKTENLEKEVNSADILVVAAGKPELIKGKWIKKGAVVIDVGINNVPDKNSEKGYKLVGDVEFENACKKASFITPVPGGVGQLTVALLLKNTFEAFKKIKNIQ